MHSLVIGGMRGFAHETGVYLHSSGVRVSHLDDIGSAIYHLRSVRDCDVALIDADLDIRRFVSQLESERLLLPIIACGCDGVGAEVALGAGAKQFLSLPTSEVDIAEVLRSESVGVGVGVDLGFGGMVFGDSVMVDLLALARKFAGTRAHILVSGETGCGKELLCSYVHGCSLRSGDLVAINCSAIAESLLESELFGHCKGSFTGAVSDRRGKFELSSGGTLLLDEISEMRVDLQSKLLRVIQEGCVDRVGGDRPVPLDLRILATTNRDILEEVSGGRFREDLYYRLSVMRLHIPPLRERVGDIALLVEMFIGRFNSEYGLSVEGMDDLAMERLLGYDFPGNVRELENIVHRSVVIAGGGVIGVDGVSF